MSGRKSLWTSVRAAGRGGEPARGRLAEPLVEVDLVGRERGTVPIEEARDHGAQPGREHLGFEVVAAGEARVRSELGSVPERCVQADHLGDRGFHLTDGAAAQLVPRLHVPEVLEDEGEPAVVVDRGVRGARRTDRDTRREVLVEAELVAVAAGSHELAGGRILRRELADDTARRVGHVTVETEVVAGAHAHEPVADPLDRRVDDDRVADPARSTEHVGEEIRGDVGVGAHDPIGHAHPAAGSGIR